MRKTILIMTLVIATVCLVSCSGKNTSKTKTENEDVLLLEGTNDFVTDYYNEGIAYKNNIIFNTEQKKFVKMEKNTYIDMEQNYKETTIKYDDFNVVIKWYWCKDGDRLLYRQDLEDVKEGTVNYGDTMIYIVTEKKSGETYLLLCKHNSHTGYSWQYPVKFNIETGEYEDIFANAMINNKSAKSYGYLRNWEFNDNKIYVDCNEQFLEPESQVWSRQIVEVN